MIHIRATINDINYERTIRNLYPTIVQGLEKAESSDRIAGFLHRKEEMAVRVLLGAMNQMTESEKSECLCELAELYKPEILKCFRNALAGNEFGKSVQFGDMKLSSDACGRIAIHLQNVNVDYNALLQNDAVQSMLPPGVGFMAKTMMRTAPGAAEKMIMGVLENENVKTRIATEIEKALAKNGVYLTVGEIAFFYF